MLCDHAAIRKIRNTIGKYDDLPVRFEIILPAVKSALELAVHLKSSIAL